MLFLDYIDFINIFLIENLKSFLSHAHRAQVVFLINSKLFKGKAIIILGVRQGGGKHFDE